MEDQLTFQWDQPMVRESPVEGSVTTEVSVCMATYRGQDFVAEQVHSILAQLGPDDELVVVDDASPDGTVLVLTALADRDQRIRLHTRTSNHGYVRTFEEALGLAKGRLLLLADQDDVWLPGRVEEMRRALRDVDVVATNLTTLGGPDGIRGPYGQPDWVLRHVDSTRYVRNIVGILAGNRPYYGCAMGLRRAPLDPVLPIPSWMRESHDLWLALYGNVFGSITHLPIRTVARRLHGENQTPNRPRDPLTVIRSRLRLLRCLGILLGRRLSSRL